ncbi:hypothetical protein BV22DRAFT_1047264 [Leucogyrophana mollusca]|uniref:Uncharacterized protein n=1 Tax=Leucogyrophana mollusca TaxID=85980 RepID=A0ACB8BHN0_9AGAM|nr:hypothetical protein BV22DRAFT_1047264 [Leucogyrophana mollusca]
MHQCLQIPEILVLISSKIHEPPTSGDTSWGSLPQREARAALACLARTCGKFKEPALDVLWSYLKSFAPLIQCLPRDLWTRGNGCCLEFTRPLCTSDWAIFQRYAQRVRVLGSSDYGPALFETTSYTIMDTLSSFLAEGACFLPNLRELNWLDPRDHRDEPSDTDFSSLLPLFLAPHLTGLCFELASGSTEPSVAELSGISSPHVSSPFIKRFECQETSETLMQSISESISHWHHLEYVNAGALNQNAMTHLCSLRSLKQLKVHLEQKCKPTSARFPPTLESFAMFPSSLTICEEYLKDVYLAPDHLYIYPTGRKRPSASSFQRFFTFLPSRFSVANLHIMEFVCSGPDVEYPPLVWSLETFKPLFEFRNMTTFRSSYFCSAELSNRDLGEIALSWPQLEVLDLGTISDWRVPSLITFKGVLYVLRNCPRLRELGLVIDATIMDPAAIEWRGTDVINARIEQFNVGCSDIRDPASVASLLSNILPRLRKIMMSRLWRNSAFDYRRDAWLQVEEFLGSFAATRELVKQG